MFLRNCCIYRLFSGISRCLKSFGDFHANLKKVLALVLAFACAFTMFAGAAFTDQADIKVDADVVDTLVSLGIVEGFEDGSFQPNATVTRAQMAKMIYVLRTGKSDASAYNDDKTSFTDIGSHWARGYIKYCQSLGIIAGKSNTKFVPNEKVSAQEAAKMLLVTLGYDATKAGLVGTNWAAKTNALADENGLLEDVNTSFTGPCPRQYAAQLIYNAIDTATVVWRDDAYTNQNYNGDDNKTIGEKYMGLHSVEGILTSFAKEDGKDTYGATVESITKQDGSKKVTLTGAKEDFTKIAKDYVALKNNKVKVLYKDTDEVYGVFALTDSNRVLSGVRDDFEIDSDKVKFNDTKYSIASTNSVKVDGTTVTTGSGENVKNTGIKTYLETDATGLAKTFAAKAISNDDTNKISLFTVEGYALAQVTYVGKDYINVSYLGGTNNSYKFKTKLEEDNATYPTDIAKDDYVAVTSDKNTSDGNFGVTKLNTVTGKITSAKKETTDDGYKIQIDGTWYKAAINNAADRADLKLDATVTVVVNAGYVVWCDDANAGATDVAAVLQTYKEGNTQKAELLFADGKTETVSLKRNAEWDTDADGDYDDTMPVIDAYQNDNSTFALVSYTKSGDSYKLQTIADGVNPTSYKHVHVAATNNVKNNRMTSGDTKYIDDNAVVFVRYKSGTEYKFSVQTGKSMKNWSDKKSFRSVVLSNESNSINYAKVVLADMGTQSLPGGSDTTYAYIFTSNTTVDADGTKYVSYDAWNGEESVTLKVEENSASAKQGNIVKYTVDANGIATFDAIYGKTDKAFQKGVLLNGTFDGSKVEGSAAIAKTTGFNIEKTAAQAASHNIDISYDDDESYVFFVDTSEDSSDGNALKTSAQNGWNTPREDTVDNKAVYTSNVAYYVETKSGDSGDIYGKDVTDHLVLIVVDVDNELDSGVFGN